MKNSLCIMLMMISLFSCEDQQQLTIDMSKGNVDQAVDQAVVDQLLADQAVVDQLLVDQAVVDQAVVDQLLVDQAVVDQLLVDQAVVDQSVIATTCLVKFQVAFPNATPTNDPIFIAGDLFDPSWSAADPRGLMERTGNMATKTLMLPNLSNIEFKFTRGDWNLVERDGNCADSINRVAFIRCNDQGIMEIQSNVLSWRNFDQCIR